MKKVLFSVDELKYNSFEKAFGDWNDTWKDNRESREFFISRARDNNWKFNKAGLLIVY